MTALIHILVLAAMILACGKAHSPKPTLTPMEEVQAKRDRYMELAKEQVDEYGWLPPRCDGLLFNSLARYSGFGVDPLLSEISPGRWERHPSRCFRNGSKSSISRDMFRGLLIWLWESGDKENLAEIKAYCDANNVAFGLGCAMGEAVDEESYWGRVVMTPGMRNQIDRMLSKTSRIEAEQEPVNVSDFEAHLKFLDIYLEFLMSGTITDSELKTIRDFANASPRNALFQIMYSKFSGDGDQSKAIEILLDETIFPADRLPRDTDRYAHYIFQRDENEDWLPCGTSEKRPCEGVTHSGIDLMFAVKLLEL